MMEKNGSRTRRSFFRCCRKGSDHAKEGARHESRRSAGLFQGSLTAKQVSEAIRAGIRRADPHADIVAKPMADGGEGTLQCLVDATDGKIMTATVKRPARPTCCRRVRHSRRRRYLRDRAGCLFRPVSHLQSGAQPASHHYLRLRATDRSWPRPGLPPLFSASAAALRTMAARACCKLWATGCSTRPISPCPLAGRAFPPEPH